MVPADRCHRPSWSGQDDGRTLWAATHPGRWPGFASTNMTTGPEASGRMSSRRCAGSGIAVPRTARRTRGPQHVFLLRLASALAAQDPPVTLVLDDFHLLTEPLVLDGLNFVLRNAGPACAWWSVRG